MKKQFKLGFIGCESGAHAILRGVVLSDFLHEKKIIVSGVSEQQSKEIACLGVKSTDDNRFVAMNSEFLVLAVSADKFSEVFESLKGIQPEKIITVVDGISKAEIKNSFGANTVKVARAILNMPCVIGSGAIGIDMSDYNRALDDIEFISNVFNCLGTVLSIDESKMDSVAGISGNGPVYSLLFIDSLIDAGIKHGLSKNEATILAVQTVLGTAEMLQQNEQTITELIKEACKNKSSLEAVKMFEQNNFRGIISDTVTACIGKSKES